MLTKQEKIYTWGGICLLLILIILPLPKLALFLLGVVSCLFVQAVCSTIGQKLISKVKSNFDGVFYND